MSPIERAARALCKLDLRDPDEITSHKPPPDQERFERAVGSDRDAEEYHYYDLEAEEWFYAWKRWRAYEEQARAVLQAIREPTREMVAEAVSEFVGDVDADLTWRTMIDAALTEGA